MILLGNQFEQYEEFIGIKLIIIDKRIGMEYIKCELAVANYK